MLAMAHGLEKFHYYLYGRRIIVETDHKLLEAIFKKTPCYTTSTHRKDDAEVKYVQGKNIPQADVLSSSCHIVPLQDLT